jgi:hypothetical protein
LYCFITPSFGLPFGNTFPRPRHVSTHCSGVLAAPLQSLFRRGQETDQLEETLRPGIRPMAKGIPAPTH